MTGRSSKMVLVLTMIVALGPGCKDAVGPDVQAARSSTEAAPEGRAPEVGPSDAIQPATTDVLEAPLADAQEAPAADVPRVRLNDSAGAQEAVPESVFATIDVVLSLSDDAGGAVSPSDVVAQPEAGADVVAPRLVDSGSSLPDALVAPVDVALPAAPDAIAAPDALAVATSDVVAQPTFDQDASRKVFEEFKKLVESGAFDRGAKLLEEWLKRSPMDLVNRQNLVHVLLKLEQYERAVPHLQFMAAEAENKGEWLGHLGRALVKLGEYARAAEALAAGLELRPDDIDLRLDLSRVHSMRKDWSASRAVLEEGLKAQKRLPELLSELAPVLVELGEYKEASARFKQLQRLQPSYDTALTMAKIASQNDRCDDVVDALVNWEKEFADETPHLLLGACASKADENVKAQKHFLLGLKANDKCFYCALWLGDIYLASQDWENAVNYYALAAPINPRDHRPFHQLGKALANQGKHIQAARALQKADERKPKEVDILYPLGMELVRAGEKAAAWDVWAKLEPLHREHADEIKALLIQEP